MSLVPYLFDVYEIEDHKLCLTIMNLIITESQKIYNQDLKAKRDQAKRAKKGKKR